MKAKNAVVGAKVQLKRSSEWYRKQSRSNPRDTTGCIISFDLDAEKDGDFSIRVDWDNRSCNAYRLKDLKLVKE